MMEPRIQYAKTADGVSIAFWTLGEGMPFVLTPSLGPNHIELLWQWPEYRASLERLAQRRRLLGYDLRGFGLSDRGVTDFSLDARVADLEVVADRLELDRFILCGLNESGPVAIAYATRHPERVSHLVLWCAWARSQDVLSISQFEAIRSLVDRDWELFTETLAHAAVGWSESEATSASRVASLIRECVAPEVYLAVAQASNEFDVTALLPHVRSPTLVAQRRQFPLVSVDIARGLASRIPDARLLLVEGASVYPFVGDAEALLRGLDEFLGEGEEAKAAAQLPEGMAVILFTDIVGSTALTEQLGDSAFRARARELDTSLRSVIREAGGVPVEGKVLGDGVMAVFTSAHQAIDCALRCNVAAQDTGLSLHLGIHAGDVIREGNTVYGGAVNIAARIAGASAAGELLVSDIVRGLARTSANVVFQDRGEHELKGVGEPQRLFAVRGEVA